MERNRQVNILDESRKPHLTIFMLAWPVFVEQIFTTLVNFVDAAMVGSLGKEATAAVSISASPIGLFNNLALAFGVGITALVAQARGAGDEERLRKLVRHALLAFLYIGVPVALCLLFLYRRIPDWMGAEESVLELAAQYNLIIGFGRFFSLMTALLHAAFRGYGDTKAPMRANLALNVVNVIGNFLLIYPTRTLTVLGVSFTMPGAGWGVAGAGMATALGMFTAGLIALHNAFKKSNPYRITLKGWQWLKPDLSICRSVFHISAPTVLERFCLTSGSILTSSSIASLGTASVAARSLCLKAESLSWMPALAFQTAITTLVGQALGARKPELAERFVRVCIRVGGSVMFITGVALFVFAKPIIGVFTPDQEVIEMAAFCLRLEAMIQVPQVIGWIFSGALRGAGDTRAIFLINASTSWGFHVPCLILSIRVFGLNLVQAYWVICAEIVIRMVVYWLRYRGGKWKNTVLRAKKEDGGKVASSAGTN